MDILGENFEPCRAQIEALFLSDQTFREIWADFENLSTLLATGLFGRELEHTRSSLAGLKEEITPYLEPSTNASLRHR